MPNIRIPAAALALVCLAGCATGPVSLTSPSDEAVAAAAAVGAANTAAVTAFPKLATFEAKLKSAFAKVCGNEWVPTSTTIANLAATLSGSVLASTLTSAVTNMAMQGCALATAPASNGVGLLDVPRVPTLNGVPLQGRFVGGAR